MQLNIETLKKHKLFSNINDDDIEKYISKIYTIEIGDKVDFSF